ncbi:right-handed parallel beta-helix repeat-containing protein [bacterium]|nr:right-handed parallel beta-helix repeat-containing protein [bacterium]
MNGNNIVIQNVRVSCTQPPAPPSAMGAGIWILDNKSNITLKNVYLNDNQYGLRSAGSNVCVIDSEANQNEDNGFYINVNAGGRYAIRNSKVRNNRWGVLMEPGTGVTAAQFLTMTAEANYREGFELTGAYAEVLCSSAIGTVPLSPVNKANSGDGHGINSRAAQLQVEDTVLAENWREGILQTAGQANVINVTLAKNDGGRVPNPALTPTPTGTPRSGAQIRRTAGTTRVYNTVAEGAIFVSSANTGPTPNCAYSVFTDSGGHANCAANATKGLVQAVPTFDRDYRLVRNSAGLDAGTNVAPTTLPTLASRVAYKEAKDGVTRPLDSNRDGVVKFDVGAFELNDPQATPTNTRTSTRTPTNTPPAPTPTFTPHCVPNCLGDCNCDGAVAVNELISGVNMALGNQGLNGDCFDCSSNGSLDISELIQAVGNATEGCPTELPEPCGTGGGMMLLSPGAGGTEVSLSTATGHRNDTIEFRLFAQYGDELTAALSADIGYPTNVLSVPECRINPQLPGGFQLSVSYPSPGVERLIAVDIGEFPLPRMADGLIATCTAKILPAAPFATHTISVTRVQLSNAFGLALTAYGVDGSVTVN